MNRLYADFFKKVKDMEQQIIKDVVAGSIGVFDIPEQCMTQDVALNIVVATRGSLEGIVFSKLDNITCLAACQLKNTNLMYIPHERSAWVSSNYKEPFLKFIEERKKSEYLCESFIRVDHKNINFVPDSLLKNRDYIKKLCLINPRILSVMSFNSLDMELCQIAVHSPDFSLTCLPESWCTDEICSLAFDKNYKEIMQFPKSLITYKYVRKAIHFCEKGEVQNILKLLDVEHFDHDLILSAIKKDEAAFNLVPYEKITVDMVFDMAPYLKSHETLYHVPEDIFNANLSHRLIACNPKLLNGIPVRFKTKVLCAEAVAADGLTLAAVPKSMMNDDLYRSALANNGLALKFVPTPYRDDEFPMLAIEQNGEAIEFVPESIIDEVICRKAVMQNPHAIYHVPKKLQSNELFLIALKHLPVVLKLIPVDMRTTEQCVIALEGSKTMYEFIPMQLRENQRIIDLAFRLGITERPTTKKAN